jgi:hypothetical protein
MSVSLKTNVNSTTYGDELRKIRELQEQFSAGAHVTFTTSGNISYTSLSSGVTYDTSASTDPNVLNKGMQGLLFLLSSYFLKSTGDGGYGDCLIDASYLSSIITAITNSELTYAEDGGSSDAYAISLEIAPTSYASGQKIAFKAHTSNTGACTLNVNGLGAKPIVDFNNNALRTGAILAGQIVTVCYDGTSFRMLSDGGLLYNRIIDTPTVYNWNGWESANETWTYASASAPNYVVTVPSDATTKYSAGMRVKLTHGGSIKYFIIVNVTSTSLTLYGGTDYTLSGTSITENYYSAMKSPLGFPNNPLKWTVEFSSSSFGSAGALSAATVTSTGLSLVVPIGLWNISYYISVHCTYGSAGTQELTCSLSTSSSSISTPDLSIFRTEGDVNPATIDGGRSKTLLLIAPTTYYIVVKSLNASTACYLRGDFATTIIRAICAYL